MAEQIFQIIMAVTWFGLVVFVLVLADHHVTVRYDLLERCEESLTCELTADEKVWIDERRAATDPGTESAAVAHMHSSGHPAQCKTWREPDKGYRQDGPPASFEGLLLGSDSQQVIAVDGGVSD